RPRHSRRAWLPPVQRLWRSAALPPAQQALRANQRRHHDESELRRVGERVRRPENDDGAPRPPHSPLPHPRNRKRQLPLQKQFGEARQTQQGEIKKLDERLTPKPSSSRVSSQRKSWVSSRRKSTRLAFEKVPAKAETRWRKHRLGFCDVGGVTNARFLMAAL